MISGQQQGSTIANIVIDVDGDKVINAYGVDQSSFVVVTPKTEYTVNLDAELTATAPDQRQELAEARTLDPNPARLARVYVKAGDSPNTIRIQLVDAAFAPAVGAAGDRVILGVVRVNVPQA